MSLIKSGHQCRPLSVGDLVWSLEKGLGGYERVKSFSGKSCVLISCCSPKHRRVPQKRFGISATNESAFKIQGPDF